MIFFVSAIRLFLLLIIHTEKNLKRLLLRASFFHQSIKHCLCCLGNLLSHSLISQYIKEDIDHALHKLLGLFLFVLFLFVHRFYLSCLFITATSVVKTSVATDTAFSKEFRVTLNGSMVPASNIFTSSFLRASYPESSSVSWIFSKKDPALRFPLLFTMRING